MVLPVVMYGCESWTVKKAERWRIDALELWCWRRLLRVPRSNQSILKKSILNFTGRTNAEAPVLWPPDAKSWLIRKDPDAGKDWKQEEEKETTEDEMVGWHHQLNGHEVWASSRRWWRTRRPGMLQSIRSQRVKHDWAMELLMIRKTGQMGYWDSAVWSWPSYLI